MTAGDEQGEQGGVIPGALHHPLSVVLWRLDELGFDAATDVEGGFEAWEAAGLPVDPV